MNRKQIDALVAQYAETEGIGSNIHEWNSSQYDDRSAAINYSLVRHYKPKVVVEFGARTGRCTHDILRALLKNGEKFVFRSYELQDDLRADAQRRLNEIFKDDAIIVGGDVTKAKDIPDGIDYLFIDNFHDEAITNWVFETLLPKCAPHCLIQIHDIPLKGDYEKGKDGTFIETDMIIALEKQGKLPLKKLYWTFEEGGGYESSWWTLK